MYTPKHFLVEDKEVIYDFIEKNGFAILFSNHNGSPTASHLPLLLDRDNGYLYGHFARPNSQWKDLINQEVLAVFHGPHSYVSSSWYESNMSVPTWNYVAVHAYGSIELIDNGEELLEDLKQLVSKYEAQNSSYQMDSSNQELVEGLMKGIVGFKLKINKLEGKWKLSQNHSKERQEKVISNLKKIDTDHAQEIARLMEEEL